MQNHITRGHIFKDISVCSTEQKNTEKNEFPDIASNEQITTTTIEKASVESIKQTKQSALEIDTLTANITLAAAKTMLNLLSHSDFSMSRALELANSMKEIPKVISNYLEIKNVDLACSHDVIEALSNPFRMISTEYKLLKFLKNNNLFIEPIPFTINKRLNLITRKGKRMLVEKESKGTMLDLRFKLKHILEIPEIFDKMYNRMLKLLQDESSISHFVQGIKWRRIVNDNPGKIILPYHLYDDDFSIGNSLGHHQSKQSISVVNLYLPLMEGWELSKLENRFPILFIDAQHTKKGKKSNCLKKLIENLIDIAEKGISFTVNGQHKTAYFILGLINGDNLAVHEMLDLTTYFKHEFACRFCLMPKKMRENANWEDTRMLRTKETYAKHTDSDAHGIKKSSPFNNVPYFHVTENYTIDLMHDGFSGFVNKGLQIVLDHCILKRYFSLNEFEEWLDNFNYGEIDSRNLLSSTNIKNGVLKLSSYECFLMLKYFTFLVGHKFNHNDVHCKYIIQLEKLINLSMLENYNDRSIFELELAAAEHLETYKKLNLYKTNRDGSVTSKKANAYFKIHNTVHYGSVIKYSGPLIHMWSFRDEGLIRIMKAHATSKMTKRNLSFTLAKVFQIRFACYIVDKTEKNTAMFIYGKKNIFDIEKKTYSLEVLIQNGLNKKIWEYKSLKYRGTTYKPGYFLYYAHGLYRILDIITPDAEHTFLVTQQYQYRAAKKQSQNYNIVIKKLDTFTVKRIEDVGKPFNVCRIVNGDDAFKINKYQHIF